MKIMNRRDFLKISSLVGTGAIVVGFPIWKIGRPSRSYFLVTDNPVRDVQHLLRIVDLGFHVEPSVESFPILPSGQDLGIIEEGRLIDPTRKNQIPGDLKNLAFELRSRRTKGHYLVSMEEYQKDPKNLITFEVNGLIMEQIRPGRNYNQIALQVKHGKSIFRLQDGRLSVVEASCRHELCKKIGGIQSGKIICAPNKLVATIKSDNTLLDGITA